MKTLESKNVVFAKYSQILRAEVVNIHTLLSYFKKADMDYDAYGNILVNFKNETKNTPIVVAHLDNVLSGERQPVMDVSGTRIFGKKTGIGFDDKAGIIAIIELWNRIPEHDFRIIFTSDEEKGGIGAAYLNSSYYQDAAYILELDRRGNKDLINVSGTTRLCSEEFASMFECYGFKRATGTFTDLNVFKPQAPHVNMANLSIGYYNAHTDDEYLMIDDFEYIVSCVEDFLKTHKETIVDDTPPETKQTSQAYNNNQSSYGRYKNTYDIYDDDFYCDWCGNQIPDERKAVYLHGEMYCCEKCANEAFEYYNKK